MRTAGLGLGLVLTVCAWGQTLTDASLTGKYFFRQLMLVSNAGGAVTEARSLLGAVTFDGAGRFTFQGQQNLGTAAATAASGGGTYSVKPSGVVTISNPLQSGLTINARLGTGAVVGSSTEGAFDVFLAIAAPAGGVSNGSLNGSFWVSTLEFPQGNTTQSRSAFFALNANGQGSFGDVSVNGLAANLGQLPLTQTVAAATYALTGDGSGTATFPIPGGSAAPSRLLGGSKVLYTSADGNYVLAGSTTAGSHDLMVGVKALPAGANNASLKDLFWGAGLRVEGTRPSSFVGAANSPGAGKLLWSRRVRTADGQVDFTGVNGYSVSSDGTGTVELNRLAVGAAGRSFLGAGVSASDSNNYELYFAVRAAPVSGSGVFLHPQGVVNAAGSSPVGNPISPGELITLYGSGLSGQTLVAASLPFPANLGGVEVLINNRPAPVYVVSAGQISALVPFATSETTATVVVVNNGVRSNSVEMPVSRTAPGIFTVPSGGIGHGAILRPDYSPVTAASPVRRGQTILIFLTGLGAVNPPVADGAAASSTTLSPTVANVSVYIGGRAAEVIFRGAAPGLAGLYQLNVIVPVNAPTGLSVPIGIETPEAFHDQAELAIIP